MKKTQINVPIAEQEELQNIIRSLTRRYQVEYIFSFGYHAGVPEVSGCFFKEIEIPGARYFLLIITKGKSPDERTVQCYVNKLTIHLDITVIVHDLHTVRKAIIARRRFFITVCRRGILLYAASGSGLNIDFPVLKAEEMMLNAERLYEHRYAIALGFVEAAEENFEGEFYNNTVFMVHHALIHASIAMINVFMDYHPVKYDLPRLLNLCCCFSDKPVNQFSSKSGRGQRLFNYLLTSSSELRYNLQYDIYREDADILCFQAREFLELTEELSTDNFMLSKWLNIFN
jgi:uncharacterized protein